MLIADSSLFGESDQTLRVGRDGLGSAALPPVFACAPGTRRDLSQAFRLACRHPAGTLAHDMSVHHAPAAPRKNSGRRCQGLALRLDGDRTALGVFRDPPRGTSSGAFTSWVAAPFARHTPAIAATRLASPRTKPKR